MNFEQLASMYFTANNNNKSLKGRLIIDPTSDKEVLIYKAHPRSGVVYYQGEDGGALGYRVEMDNGQLVQRMTEPAPWKSLKEMLQVFNTGYNTSYYGWYIFRDFLDLNSVTFLSPDGQVVSSLKGAPHIKILAKFIDNYYSFDIQDDGKSIDMREYGFSFDTLWLGPRNIVKTANHTKILEAFIKYYNSLELGDEVDVNGPGAIIDSALKLIADDDWIIETKGDTTRVTSSSSSSFEAIMDRVTGESTFNGRGSIIDFEMDPYHLASDLKQLRLLSANHDNMTETLEFESSRLSDLAEYLKELDSNVKENNQEEVLTNIAHIYRLATPMARKGLPTNARKKVSTLYSDVKSMSREIRDYLAKNPAKMRQMRQVSKYQKDAESLVSFLNISLDKLAKGIVLTEGVGHKWVVVK